MDACGHVIHIDFGYLLSKTISFEKAPFKLTSEFVDVMGGYKSPCYKEYCRLCVKAFLAVRKHFKKIMLLVDMMMEGKIQICRFDFDHLIISFRKRKEGSTLFTRRPEDTR